MRYIIIAVLLSGCTYTVTDDARVSELANQQRILEQRQDALESRANAQGEEINKLRRGLFTK